MSSNPYSALPAKAFWRSGVAEAARPVPQHLYERKWVIDPQMQVATAGSCFAQHIGRHMRDGGFSIMDVEPAPKNLPKEMHTSFGYAIYSARYGNIYTVRQMLQLAQEALGRRETSREVWRKADRFVDALRPTIEPDGFSSAEVVLRHRERHLERVREMLTRMDLFIFTLGLTEAWVDAASGVVYPVCPGTVAGDFDPQRHLFKNFSFTEIMGDFLALRELLQSGRSDGGPRFLLTVSPVPLTATAGGRHVQVATTHSKSVLRAVAGELAERFADIDYFPSYEIISSPWSGECFYEPNMRSVTAAGVANVMRTFMAAHGKAATAPPTPPAPPPPQSAAASPPVEDDMAVVCDEELLDAFGKAPL